MTYFVIYDGNCNLCVTFVQALENLDQGQQFQYSPMQDEQVLRQLAITPQDCEKGVILINAEQPEQRWQGSEAAEEIGRLLPIAGILVDLYRWLPGVKPMGDRAYEYIRDNRYVLFGKRNQTYEPSYPVCRSDNC